MARGLVIRADATSAIGSGHAMRMLALAEAWRGAGGRAVFVGAIPERLAARFAALGVGVEPSHADVGSADDATRTALVAGEHQCCAVVCDGYGFGISFQRTIKAAGCVLLVVDDNGENLEYAADVVLNGNPHATETLYRNRGADTRLLLGTRYTLVRAEVQKAAGEVREVPERARRVLVTMGGADPANATGRILQAVVDQAPRFEEFEFFVLVGPSNSRADTYRSVLASTALRARVEHDVADVTVPMRWAQVALAAAGSTVWELALLGVPSLVATLAPNQEALSRLLVSRGAVESLGDLTRLSDSGDWVARFLRLSDDREARQRLIRASHGMVDGQGAVRVVRILGARIDAGL